MRSCSVIGPEERQPIRCIGARYDRGIERNSGLTVAKKTFVQDPSLTSKNKPLREAVKHLFLSNRNFDG